MARTRNLKKTVAKIPFGVEERIVEVSLKHPDYDACRLVPLLEQGGTQVSASVVHAILKRNDLHTKSKRTAKLEAQHSAETSPEQSDSTLPRAEQQDHAPADTAETKYRTRISPSIKALKKTNPRSPWSLSVPNLLLLGII